MLTRKGKAPVSAISRQACGTCTPSRASAAAACVRAGSSPALHPAAPAVTPIMEVLAVMPICRWFQAKFQAPEPLHTGRSPKAAVRHVCNHPRDLSACRFQIVHGNVHMVILEGAAQDGRSQ